MFKGPMYGECCTVINSHVNITNQTRPKLKAAECIKKDRGRTEDFDVRLPTPEMCKNSKYPATDGA